MPCRASLLFGIALLAVAGCTSRTATEQEEATGIVDRSFLTHERWNDGRAEIAFYDVQRARNAYGEQDSLQFTVGTYLVKHSFNPEKLTKATTQEETRTPSFKYALFYEFASGSYQYKRNYVVNSRQATLQPLKASFTSFDWCSNQYRELAFPQDAEPFWLKRSDDYGNARRTFEGRRNTFTSSQLPLLVRALDFQGTDTRQFWVVTQEGAFVRAEATRAGRDTLRLSTGATPAERIAVRYDAPAPSMIAGETGQAETYWRGAGPWRLLLRVESDGYEMQLREHLRSPYWQENVYDRLRRISERP